MNKVEMSSSGLQVAHTCTCTTHTYISTHMHAYYTQALKINNNNIISWHIVDTQEKIALIITNEKIIMRTTENAFQHFTVPKRLPSGYFVLIYSLLINSATAASSPLLSQPTCHQLAPYEPFTVLLWFSSDTLSALSTANQFLLQVYSWTCSVFPAETLPLHFTVINTLVPSTI